MFFIWELQHQINKRSSITPNPRRLITISTGDGRWHGKWDSEYLLSLRDLRLEDLVDDERQKNAQVSIKLSVQKVTLLSLFCLLVYITFMRNKITFLFPKIAVFLELWFCINNHISHTSSDSYRHYLCSKNVHNWEKLSTFLHSSISWNKNNENNNSRDRSNRIWWS